MGPHMTPGKIFRCLELQIMSLKNFYLRKMLKIIEKINIKIHEKNNIKIHKKILFNQRNLFLLLFYFVQKKLK